MQDLSLSFQFFSLLAHLQRSILRVFVDAKTLCWTRGVRRRKCLPFKALSFRLLQNNGRLGQVGRE